jgi:MYXO-CTERM domain-containing protein
MKKILPLFAAAMLGIVATAPAVIIFNPDNPLNVVDQGGFTGISTSPGGAYNQALVRFTFSGLNPAPTTPFVISNIFLKGPGIGSSISFGSLTISDNIAYQTAYVSLGGSTVQSVDFEDVTVSFDVPKEVMNYGASFSMAVRYADATDDQRGTSTTGPVFEAQNVGPEPIPEPGTWAAAALLVGGAAFMRWRRRQTA